MIEELEAKAVLQMINEEQGRLRGRVTQDHQGAVLEVRARRRRDGGVVFGYSYERTRLEKAVLLLLICPFNACGRSIGAKERWRTEHPMPEPLKRRPRSGLKSSMVYQTARLFDEVPVGSLEAP